MRDSLAGDSSEDGGRTQVVLFRVLHTLALFWMMAGLGTVMVAIWRAWATSDLETRLVLLTEAAEAETRWLLPGILATGITGFAWAASDDTNLVTTGWLLALEIVFSLDVFIFLPLMGVGLRRVRLLALQARKQGEVTDELRTALDDRVPIVFGTLIVVSVPIMTVLAVWKPF
ncbi:MAG: DUF2269 family protein [Chloroflexi bacterium]|nr:DUF2269 family protein [Chloroflexota bacterium]MQC28109.1 DUF2269 family protein [Chloroflexota bacterium]